MNNRHNREPSTGIDTTSYHPPEKLVLTAAQAKEEWDIIIQHLKERRKLETATEARKYVLNTYKDITGTTANPQIYEKARYHDTAEDTVYKLRHIICLTLKKASGVDHVTSVVVNPDGSYTCLNDANVHQLSENEMKLNVYCEEIKYTVTANQIVTEDPNSAAELLLYERVDDDDDDG
jgi:esterase/lipase